MSMLSSKFLADESGAVTVDWVVLTAAIVGIAIAVLTLIAAGINTSSNSTSETLSTSGSVASLIGGGSYDTWQDYLDGNGGDANNAFTAAAADAPDGYEFDGFYDNETGAPIYFSRPDGVLTYSIGGNVTTESDYTQNGGTQTRVS